MQIPTQVADSGRFTYAVPLGHVPTPVDRALAERAGLSLAAYEARRPRMIDAEEAIKALRQLNDQFEDLAIIERSRDPEATVVSPH